MKREGSSEPTTDGLGRAAIQRKERETGPTKFVPDDKFRV